MFTRLVVFRIKADPSARLTGADEVHRPMSRGGGGSPSGPVFRGLRVMRAGKGAGWARLLSHLFRNRRGVRRGVKSLGRTARSWAA